MARKTSTSTSTSTSDADEEAAVTVLEPAREQDPPTLTAGAREAAAAADLVPDTLPEELLDFLGWALLAGTHQATVNGGQREVQLPTRRLVQVRSVHVPDPRDPDRFVEVPESDYRGDVGGRLVHLTAVWPYGKVRVTFTGGYSRDELPRDLQAYFAALVKRGGEPVLTDADRVALARYVVPS